MNKKQALNSLEGAEYWARRAYDDVNESLHIRARMHVLALVESMAQACLAVGLTREEVLKRVGDALTVDNSG